MNKVINDYCKHTKKFPKDSLAVQNYNKELNKLSLQTPKVAATGSVLSAIFYFKFNLACENYTFDGTGGGISSPGGGALFGDIYSDNLELLYTNTEYFQFNCTPVYTSLLFFDNNSTLLGHFQSGSVSTVLGIGGGSGKWKSLVK